MNFHRLIALFILPLTLGSAGLAVGCKKTTATKVAGADPAASVFCHASQAWFTALGIGHTGPKTTLAVGVAFSVAAGQIEKSEACSGGQDRQYGVNDLALLTRDELANNEMQKTLRSLDSVQYYIDNDYNNATIGGDSRSVVTDDLEPKITTAVAAFNDKGLPYGGSWAMATALHMKTYDLLIARDQVSTAAPSQITAVLAKDAASALRIANAIEAKVGQLQKAADAAAAKMYETKVYPRDIPNVVFGSSEWCRSPKALTSEQQAYADSFFTTASVPGTLLAQKKRSTTGRCA